jgi:hypothetical protein
MQGEELAKVREKTLACARALDAARANDPEQNLSIRYNPARECPARIS